MTHRLQYLVHLRVAHFQLCTALKVPPEDFNQVYVWTLAVPLQRLNSEEGVSVILSCSTNFVSLAIILHHCT